MNNIQLAVLIDKYLGALEAAIANAEDKLPKDERQTSKIMGFKVETYPILDDLYSLKSVMEHDIETLTEKEK